jgi:DNA-binding LacI/PurR family transcriptional regulator
MGYSVWRPVFHRAVADLFQITTVALRRIERLGYRRIGLMMEHRLDERTNHQYSAAFLDWQRTVPVRQRVPLTVLPKWDEPMFRKWFRRHTPEAIVCPDPKPIRWIEAANLRVPDDVGFVNLCESPMHTGLAAMRHHPRLVGAAAVDLVVAQLQRNELGIPAHPKIVLIEGEWVDGPTVRRWP